MKTLRRLVRPLLVATGLGPRREAGPDYLHQQVERSWDKESRNLQWFGVRDGASILDLGCGPGHFTRRVADRFPGAQITALDSEATMLDHARSRLGGRASLVCATAEATGLPSASFDFVLARLLFQHLRNPMGVAIEARRVLKAGGKLVITDVDDDLFGVVEPPVSGLADVLDRYAAAQAARGGNRRVGRILVRLLRDAGFADTQMDGIAIHSDEAGLEACFPQLDPMPLRALVSSGRLSELEYSKLRAEHGQFSSADDPFAIVLLFMACGTRPLTGQAPA